LRALALQDVTKTGRAADVHGVADRAEAEVAIDLRDQKIVRKKTRVNVGGVKQRQRDLALTWCAVWVGRTRGLSSVGGL
jgi:hypothetical protein